MDELTLEEAIERAEQIYDALREEGINPEDIKYEKD